MDFFAGSLTQCRMVVTGEDMKGFAAWISGKTEEGVDGTVAETKRDGDKSQRNLGVKAAVCV